MRLFEFELARGYPSAPLLFSGKLAPITTLLKRVYNSDNWCGAVKTAANISEVEATWTVPAISIPVNASKTDHFSSYQWIGMGGTGSCPNNGDLLQAGTGAEINGGDPFYYAYYQLFGTGGPMVNRDLTGKRTLNVSLPVTACMSR
ncbi:hypothetical protein NLG97_g8337 [Lecanicillium saksenae]|uniref:Uncharacterized protein n=1 Tax=Lecanicillium saksenae TaxID=468837 RepID=A0ACC1QMG8_9HYPO|nr:hypothetical protein NLG97_g8337 [Lecanicillium saksenae]